MSDFIRFFKGFKWFVIGFLALITLIVIPAKLHEHKYLEVILVALIMAFIITILWGLSHYFLSMAVSFRADKEQAYFTYANGESMVVPHSQIQQIKCTPYRYIFILDNNDKVFLTRIVGRFRLEQNIDGNLKELYPKKIL